MVLTFKTVNKMTEALKIGMEAVNRWLFHAWNYEQVNMEIPNYYNGGTTTTHIPRFLAEAKWTCNLAHMIDKWNAACQSRNTDAYLVKFYANLDGDNRKALLEWVLQNYTDEQKLF